MARLKAGDILRAAAKPRAGKPDLRLRARPLDVRRNRFVTVMKFLLPGVALALLALIAAWPSLRQIEDVVRLKIDGAAIAAADPRMIAPRLLGMDRGEQPFTVTAKTAARIPSADGREVYELVQPKADITMKDGTWLALSADTGVFQRDQQVLELFDNVNLYQDQGYEFTTTNARIDLAQRIVTGDQPVHGVGPFGQVEAEGFRIGDHGQRFEFIGRTRLVFTAQKDAP
ncbi:MAG: LPS export ABC transporter periplasmic protein LptC [Alphaproteobacteria bacterium]|nr:LPS export ABC transporter periplasmic protein LptC [Alphaproteobacteria bacterium]